jgi:hypothetical protein
MQYLLPQFIDVEDKLIGPLTLKQFLVMLGIGAVIFMYFTVFNLGIVFYLLSIPTAIFGAYITWYKYNGKPIYAYVIPFVMYMVSPRQLIYARQPQEPSADFRITRVEKTKETKSKDSEPAESRLKRLAYLLEKEAQQEKELIQHSSVLIDLGEEAAAENYVEIKSDVSVQETQAIAKSRQVEPKRFFRPQAKPTPNPRTVKKAVVTDKESDADVTDKQPVANPQNILNPIYSKPASLKESKQKKFDPSDILSKFQ